MLVSISEFPHNYNNFNVKALNHLLGHYIFRYENIQPFQLAMESDFFLSKFLYLIFFHLMKMSCINCQIRCQMKLVEIIKALLVYIGMYIQM